MAIYMNKHGRFRFQEFITILFVITFLVSAFVSFKLLTSGMEQQIFVSFP